MTTPFARLAHLGQQLEQTSSRLELAALLAELLGELTPEEVAPAVRMIVGRVFPEWDERVLNVSWRIVDAILEELTDTPPAVREEIRRQAVDGGEAVRLRLERTRSVPLQPPPLALLEVFQIFEEIAKT